MTLTITLQVALRIFVEKVATEMETDGQINQLDITMHNPPLFSEESDRPSTSLENDSEFFTEHFVCSLGQVCIT